MTTEEQASPQDIREGTLVHVTIECFLEQAKKIGVRDMTALTASLIDSLVFTLARNTDGDTALQVLSRILIELAPECQRGEVHIIHKGPEAKQ